MSFANILICNFSASIMILLTLLIRKIVKYRLPNSVICLLWLMIGIRLLFPVQIRTPWSILNVYFHFRNRPLFIKSFQEPEMRPASIAGSFENIGVAAEEYKAFVIAVWLVGFCIAAVCFAKEYFKDRKYMADSRPLEKAEWLESCLAEQKMRRKILLRVKEGLECPMTWGVVKPVIFFPADFDFGSKQFSRLVLFHECGHIKYFHFVFKLWNAVLASLYWYNPIVWVMYLKFERDLEISADRYVLRRSTCEERKIYARHFLETVEAINAAKKIEEQKRKIKYVHMFYHFMKNQGVKERTEAIVNFKKMGKIAAVMTLLVPMGMTTVFASTNIVLATEKTDVSIQDEINVVSEENYDVEEAEVVSISVEWDELQDYVSQDPSRAASYLIIENYKYVTYGRIPPQGLKVTTTVDGHKYAGTLNRTDYVYNDATDKYTGYYTGRVYLQD